MLIMKKIINESKNEIIKNIREFKLIIILFFLYLLFFKLVLPNETNCLVKMTTGFPCPTCGMTRASFALLSFQFATAFQFHPLVYFMPFITIIVLLRDLYFFKYIFYSKVFWLSMVALLMVVYIIRMVFYFPDTAPLDYNYKALIYILI